jgi:thioesterase domain-containing protein
MVLPMILSGMDDAGKAGAAIDDTRLTAMGAYLRLFAEWEPQELKAPTALVRASDPAWSGVDGSGWQVSWRLPHTSTDVSGDHFSMMGEHAELTAATVQEILDHQLVLPES